MSTFSNSTLPNPFTPLAFLPPELSNSLQIATFLQMIAFGVFLSDIFTNLGKDYEITVKHKVGRRLPTFVYFMSRLSTIALMVTTTIIMGGADINCIQAGIVMKITMFMTKVTTSLLSFLRVRAIYEKKLVRNFFLVIWIINVVGDALSFLVMSTARFPSIPIKICTFTGVHRELIAVAFFVRLLHDTLIFFAISYRLWRLSEALQPYQDRDSGAKQFWDRIRMFFAGHNMPPFSRLLLKDGQLYYLISTLSIVIVVILVFIPTVDDYYLAFALTSYLAVFNCMAGHVFRDVKLGRIREKVLSDSYQANRLLTRPSDHSFPISLSFPNNKEHECYDNRSGFCDLEANSK
ncbi:hypothetical protein K435DRAFT_716076 [Dendrothele bispora CBS 962.96]|uniref:Transmembrane protein n=1 Tax=Dendrothele bispora (strain CBS 962.96) TaxID=1314807 RepID=A0A4S8MKS9_DENBC|nr:hypothetical protein K435DRAFT_716076 [Dendrothele bispora CBS 962.96]